MSNLTPIDGQYLVFNDPKLLSTITRHVANGGSLIEMSKQLGQPYCDLIGWIRADKTRSAAYDQALKDRDEWDREQIMQEIRDIGSFDIRQILSPDGGVLPTDQWPDQIAKSIAGMDVFEEFAGLGQEREMIGHIKKFKTVDKLKALELRAKALSMLVEKREVSGHVTLDQLIMAAGSSKDVKQG